MNSATWGGRQLSFQPIYGSVHTAQPLDRAGASLEDPLCNRRGDPRKAVNHVSLSHGVGTLSRRGFPPQYRCRPGRRSLPSPT